MEINLDDWDKLKTQSKVYYDDIHETVLMAAGLGSGKTHGLCRKALKLSAINRNCSGGILAPDFPSYKKDIEPELFSIIEDKLQMREGKHFKYNRSDKTWRFCWNKNPIYIFTAEKPIAGPNLGWGLVNEFSLVPYDRLKEFLRRVRIKNVRVKQKGLYGTPEDVHGWLEEFIETMEKQKEKNDLSFKMYNASTSENIHIDSNYTSHLETMLDSQALKVFMDGQIVRLGGNYFYYAFSQKNVSESIVYEKDLPVCCTLDFNIGRMTTSFWHKIGHIAHCFDELVLLGNSDTIEMAKAIKARFGTNCILYMDASAKNRVRTGLSDLEYLRKEGFQNIRIKTSNPTFRDRQLLVNGKLERSEIMINPKCKAVIKDLKSVKQLKSDFSKDKSVPELTHASDGLDYFIDYEFPFNINRKSSTIQL